mmetsp:Transcript_12367/g.19224  ORF Transcript_12367/g.19224 Transcript_12367/m.19224 type:complete len:216 (+) Transcript_12367:679-1326(+)
MQDLVNECISYVVTNLHDIVRLPIDMSCLNETLLQQIAVKVPIDRLDKLLDKRDKLTSRIFHKKLENLLGLLSIPPVKKQLETISVEDEEVSSPEWTPFMYTETIHDFLWQPDISGEVAASLQEENSPGIHLFDPKYERYPDDYEKAFVKIEAPKEVKGVETPKPANLIEFCSACGVLYTKYQNERANCRKSREFVDFHGHIVRRHTPDPGFDFF